MADDEPSGAQQNQPLGAQVLGGPFVLDDGTMEDIIEKLKLLNYETEFCPTGKPPFKLLTKSYFAQQSDNANLQFYCFTSLVSWLMSQCGTNSFPPPGQFDDPNATSTNILTELRSMNLSVANLAPNRIRQGHGEAVLNILGLLVDKALITRGFNFRPVEYLMERLEDDGDIAEQQSSTFGNQGDEIDDHVAVDSDEEDEVYVAAGGASKSKDDAQMIAPQVSSEQWNLEVERVAPMLQIRSEDIRDWRARIEHANTLLKAVEKMYPETKVMLQRLEDDLDKAKDRIQKREATLAQQFSDHVEEYRVKLRDLNATQESYQHASNNVSQLSAELNQVSEGLEQCKREIEDREAKISDTSPLMQVKDALSKVRAEIKQMSLRIGVLQHTVLHYKLRQSRAKREGRSEYAQDDLNEQETFVL